MLFWMLFLGIYEGGKKKAYSRQETRLYNLLISAWQKPGWRDGIYETCRTSG